MRLRLTWVYCLILFLPVTSIGGGINISVYVPHSYIMYLCMVNQFNVCIISKISLVWSFFACLTLKLLFTKVLCFMLKTLKS